MKNYTLLFVLLAIAFFTASAQTSKKELFTSPEKTAGVYFAYPVHDIGVQTPPPADYSPFYMSHYGRHGSRYLISDHEYKWVLDLLQDALKANSLSPSGINTYNRLKEVWVEAKGRGGDLAPLGVRQQRGIAERMYASFPEVFVGNAPISARSTTVIRCVLSMDALSERLKEFNPNLQINRESSNKYMQYLNFHTEEAMAFTSANDTWREEHRKFEESHTKPDRLIASLFSDTAYVRKKVNPAAFMWGLYRIASDMQNMETEISFYDVFDKQELFDLWQSDNYRLYVCDATASLNNGLMFANAKPLLKNIIESANEAITSNGVGATLRFGHDGNIIPLAAILHLENCYNSVSEPSEFYQAWSDFKIAPMAGNIQLIFFKNSSNDVLVKFMLNENEVLVPPVKTDIAPYYRWKDVEHYYNSLLTD